MKYESGDKVRFISARGHKRHPEWAPEVGTIGTVLKALGENLLWVQWPTGSTSDPDKWVCPVCYVEGAK